MADKQVSTTNRSTTCLPVQCCHVCCTQKCCVFLTNSGSGFLSLSVIRLILDLFRFLGFRFLGSRYLSSPVQCCHLRCCRPCCRTGPSLPQQQQCQHLQCACSSSSSSSTSNTVSRGNSSSSNSSGYHACRHFKPSCLATTTCNGLLTPVLPATPYVTLTRCLTDYAAYQSCPFHSYNYSYGMFVRG
jgi:hypothetical protein